MGEFHTVGTDTEKACDVNIEVTAGFENRWADDGPKLPDWMVVQEKVL